MGNLPYSYKQELSTRYVFTSEGKKAIPKVVEFTPTSSAKIYNLGFGDMLTDGRIDDISNSNNGDIIRVFSTIIYIIKDFTSEFPGIKIIFTGSTRERTSLYNRILNTHFISFSEEFKITALIENDNEFEEVEFEANSNKKYFAFLYKELGKFVLCQQLRKI
jgi:hypothetical protein